jgi:hypothetical protein
MTSAQRRTQCEDAVDQRLFRLPAGIEGGQARLLFGELDVGAGGTLGGVDAERFRDR